MTTTKMIDVDPRVLRDAAQAALHAAQQSWTHLQSELDFEQSGDVETVMATLVENGPYSFTSSGGEEGSRFEATVAQANKPGVASTREAVFKHYTKVHGSFVIEAFQPMIEIRGSWYTFFESLTTLGIKGTTDSAQMVNLVLMASGTGRGITGEISAAVDPAAARAAASSAGVSFESFRQQRVAQLDEVLAALLGADTEALVKLLGEDAQSLIRDYVDDTGALVNLDGGDAHRAHYDALFEKYRFERADVLHRVSQEVYLFAETRLTAAPRAGDGAPIAFHIAEWYTTAPDGGLVRMGHGSDVG